MQALTIEQPFISRLAGRHSIWMSVSLHLLPGLLAGAVYYLLAQPIAQLGLPSIVALMAAGVLVTIPFELGVLAWVARQGYPRPLPFKEVIEYRQPIPFWHYLALVPSIFVATGLLFTLLTPVTRFFQTQFGWLPGPMLLNIGLDGSFPRSTLVWVTIFNALLVAIALPIAEELYFRGFLLPRMPERLKGWTPLVHSFLFAAYHTWTPWMIVARTIGLRPFFYVVRRERNIYVGMIVHCLANLVDVITVFIFIAGLS